jgi:hypothetical protein
MISSTPRACSAASTTESSARGFRTTSSSSSAANRELAVYDGLASERHPTARLAALLDDGAPTGKARQLVLQTVLLTTLP